MGRVVVVIDEVKVDVIDDDCDVVNVVVIVDDCVEYCVDVKVDVFEVV